MFFWNQQFTLNNSFKTSLQACHKTINPRLSDKILNPKSKKQKTSKRTLFLTPSEYHASICVEASLSFSFFLFFLINIFSIIFLYMTYSKDLADLQRKGKEAAAYAYTMEEVFDTEEKLIILTNSTTVKSLVPVIAAPTSKLISKCVVKPWTGYDVTNPKGRKEEEQIVYMTEYGTVYHVDRGCGYLSLSIRATSPEQVTQERNESGTGYTACELCQNQSFTTAVFVTSYGNRYHTSLTCRGLKRSIKRVPLSEISGVSACSKCG